MPIEPQGRGVHGWRRRLEATAGQARSFAGQEGGPSPPPEDVNKCHRSKATDSGKDGQGWLLGRGVRRRRNAAL